MTKNIFKTYLLFSVFLVVVIGLGWVFSYVYQNQAILIYAAIFSVLMSVGSYWFSHKLVVMMTRAKPLNESESPKIYTIIRALAEKAKIPMPKIYFVDEAQPNAFATGRNPKNSLVAVTRGLLEKLNDKEVEGVLSHEISHITNRDMLVSTVAVVLVGFISILADFFIRSLFFRSMFGGRDRRQAGGLIIILGIVASILAPLAATLMRLAISRRREALADISGAALTHEPQHLASALEKIGSAQIPMKVANNTTEHLWIDTPFKGSREAVSFLHRLFLSHPPMEERVKTLRELKF